MLLARPFPSRALLLFSTMVSGFDNVHIRANVPRLEEAIKYGQSAGDRYVEPYEMVSASGVSRESGRIYTSFATAHLIVTKLYVGDHRKSVRPSKCVCRDAHEAFAVSELVVAAEEVRSWDLPAQTGVVLTSFLV